MSVQSDEFSTKYEHIHECSTTTTSSSRSTTDQFNNNNSGGAADTSTLIIDDCKITTTTSNAPNNKVLLLNGGCNRPQEQNNNLSSSSLRKRRLIGDEFYSDKHDKLETELEEHNSSDPPIKLSVSVIEDVSSSSLLSTEAVPSSNSGSNSVNGGGTVPHLDPSSLIVTTTNNPGGGKTNINIATKLNASCSQQSGQSLETSSNSSSPESLIKHVYSISNDVVLYDYRFSSSPSATGGGPGGPETTTLSELETKPLNLYCGGSGGTKTGSGSPPQSSPTDESHRRELNTAAAASSSEGGTGNSVQDQPSTNDIHDMAAILGQTVKNEPEDLTGVRRNPSPDHHVQQAQQGHHHVVLSNSDLSNATNFSPSTSSGASQAFGAGDFVSYETGGRGNNLYTTPASSDSTSFRSESEIYNSSGTNFVQRSSGSEVQYVQYNPYKTSPGTTTLSGTNQIASPDSGIGDSTSSNITETSQNESFEYPPADIINDMTNRKPWHEYGRQGEEKVHIDKIFSPYGFRYTLEAASSSSVRREDDKITYVNKGQFYGITLEYAADPELPPLKSQTVKSVIMLVFREGKSPEEELKAWQFWHARQHSVKQRILDADTKNSVGLVGCIDEIAHNALAIYWNPLESPAKVNIAVQCLSTDFSTQKGVKGLPLHLQIDTFEDPRESPGVPVYHRGYYQIKVFCDKGAERKTRDEERRAAKRRMSTNGKRRMEEMYHAASERSEFYSMADLSKPPVLFSPSDDLDKSSVSGLEFGSELPGYFSSSNSRGSPLSIPTGSGASLPPPQSNNNSSSLAGGTPSSGGGHSPSSLSTSHLLNKLHVVDDLGVGDHGHANNSGQSANSTLLVLPPEKRPKLIPPLSDRIMIYVRQETEDAYTPLHLIPPTVAGLIRAVETKYKINANNIRFLYKKSKGGILAKIDDDMLKYYCNEDVFLMQVMVTEGAGGEDHMVYDITLSEC